MAERQYVHVSVENRVATLTIDHPPANAFNTQVMTELGDAFDEVTANDEVKVIIVTGAGQLFVAGADINEIAELKDKPEEAAAFIRSALLRTGCVWASRKSTWGSSLAGVALNACRASWARAGLWK